MKKRALYLKEARRVAKHIRSQHNPKQIIIFGSLADPENENPRDIDIFVLQESSIKSPAKRVAKIWDALGGPLQYPVDIVVRTPEEFNNWDSQLADDIIKFGKVIYER